MKRYKQQDQDVDPVWGRVPMVGTLAGNSLCGALRMHHYKDKGFSLVYGLSSWPEHGQSTFGTTVRSLRRRETFF